MSKTESEPRECEPPAIIMVFTSVKHKFCIAMAEHIKEFYEKDVKDLDEPYLDTLTYWE